MSKLQCLQRQLEEIDVLRAVYPEEGCIILASAEQDALQAAAAAVEAADASAYIPNISGLVRIPGLQLWGAPVDLRFCLPGLYPEAAAAEVSVDCSAPRAVHDKLTTIVKQAATSVGLGECSLLVIVEALQVAVQAILAEHPEAAPSAAATRSEKSVAAAGAAQHTDNKLLRCAVWFHHIKSTTKRKQLVAWARELDVRGYSKPGFPGVLVCEGREADAREYLARVRSLSWQAMQVRGEQLALSQVSKHQDPLQHDSHVPGAGWAFAAKSGFQELPETGMSQLGQICKEAGLEDLFLAALKIERQ